MQTDAEPVLMVQPKTEPAGPAPPPPVIPTVVVKLAEGKPAFAEITID